MDLISTTPALADACTRFAAQSFVTVDTEFMRETTYYPKLCLIQMAGPDGSGVLVDPLSPDLDLAPFFALMADEGVVKVFHSARQDLEIIWLLGGLLPQPFFDTQVAAMVCGYGDSVSYEQLVNDVAKAKIDKSSRFTDWSRRPLSDAQLTYALSDVTHLVKVYEVLAGQLLSTDRGEWLDEEMSVLTSPETYRADPASAWRRLSGRMRKPREIAVLIEVAAWREREAQSRNVPRGRILKDEAIDEIATQAPLDVEGFNRLRSVPKGFGGSRLGLELIEELKRVMADPEAHAPKLDRPAHNQPAPPSVVELLKVLLKAKSDNAGVASKLIATVSDLEKIALADDADVDAMKGWRRQLFGEDALKLKRGEIALVLNGPRVEVVEIE